MAAGLPLLRRMWGCLPREACFTREPAPCLHKQPRGRCRWFHRLAPVTRLRPYLPACGLRSAKALRLEADSVHLHQLMGQQLRRKATALQALLADPLAVWDPMVTMVASIHAPLR